MLCVTMLLSIFPSVALATEGNGLCEHHTEHLECGYVEGESACGYVCEACTQTEEETTEPEETTESEATEKTAEPTAAVSVGYRIPAERFSADDISVSRFLKRPASIPEYPMRAIICVGMLQHGTFNSILQHLVQMAKSGQRPIPAAARYDSYV